MWSAAYAAALLVSASVVSCKQVQPEQSEICEILTRCGEPREACELFEQVRVSDDCLVELATSHCSEHKKDIPEYMDTCFPGCDPSMEYGCLEDGAVVMCQRLVSEEIEDEPRLIGLDCGVACALLEQSYTGVCGKEYESRGVVMRDAFPQCWCE